MQYFLLLTFLFLSIQLSAQTTWGRVYTILNTNCAGSGCHDGSSQLFDVTASPTDLYAALVGVNPANPISVAKGEKLVMPGAPYQSFLLRKVAHGLGSAASSDLDLSPGEGDPMPSTGSSLTPVDVEMIRQWILGGASDLANYPTADSALISNYYSGGGMPFISRPTPPPAGQGIQIHLGPIFYTPLQEQEFFYKFNPAFTQALAVNQIEATMNNEVWHHTLNRFALGAQANYADGIEALNPLTAFSADRMFQWRWSESGSLALNPGLAFFYDNNTVLDLNVHAVNHHANILPVEIYLNIYFDNNGQAGNTELKSKLVNNAAIFLPPNNATTLSHIDNSSTGIYVWALSSVARSRCVDFLMYQQSAGVQGDLLYNGKIDYQTGVNTGMYDWQNPPVFFAQDSGIFIPSQIKWQATYDNNTNNTITFGFTAANEMMMATMLYTDQQVYPAPLVNITGPANPVCADSAVLSVAGPYVAYLWSNGETTPTITVTQNGQYKVTLTDAGGTTSVSQSYQVIFGSSAADFDYTVSSNIIQLTALNQNISQTYQWSVGGSPIGTGAITTYPAQNGTAYLVTLIATNTCGSDTISKTIYVGNVQGSVYKDDNANGQQDAAETGLANRQVTITPGPHYAVTDADGRFYASLPNGSYTARYTTLQYWEHTFPNADSINFSVANGIPSTVLNFGTRPIPNITDVAIDFIPNQYVSGFTATGWLVVRNLGTVAASGSATLVLDSTLTLINATVPPDFQQGHTATWDYTNLAPGNEITIYLDLQVAIVNFGVITNTTASVTPVAGDADTTNNVSQNNDLIFGAFDPNDKQVTPGRSNTETLFTETLDYTIRFQNVGNFKATNVRIEDTLDVNLDVTTLEIIATSHTMDYVITGTHNVAFYFNNINLPDSTSDEAGSHGFIKYRIKPLDGLAENTLIENTAHIYFDFQDAVVTNTTQNKLVSVLSGLGAPLVNKLNVLLYPNPADNKVYIRLDKPGQGTLQIFNLTGQLLMATDLTHQHVDIAHLSSGLYLYTVTVEGYAPHYGKLVVE